jgi:hypothetical protein
MKMSSENEEYAKRYGYYFNTKLGVLYHTNTLTVMHIDPFTGV